MGNVVVGDFVLTAEEWADEEVRAVVLEAYGPIAAPPGAVLAGAEPGPSDPPAPAHAASP